MEPQVTERSIAEIIGWKHVATTSSVSWPPMWYGPNGEITPLRPDPTVDDLLAWLRERNVNVYGGRAGEYDEGSITATPVEIAVYWWQRIDGAAVDYSRTMTGDTLRAALEAAVRVVDASRPTADA